MNFRKAILKAKYLVSNESMQYKTLLIVVLSILGITGILNYWKPTIFLRFFGDLNPVIIISFSAILSFFLLTVLRLKSWFSIYRNKGLKKIVVYIPFMLFFVAISVFVDSKIVFPRDMNIRFPESLLFYPVIAFFVEIIFHVLPLTIVLLLLTSVFKTSDLNKTIWISIIVVALLEPAYQVIYMTSQPTWSMMVVWVNLLLFNLLQLFIFKKYGFITMYLSRLIYYLFWHIAWGHFRLDLLF